MSDEVSYAQPNFYADTLDSITQAFQGVTTENRVTVYSNIAIAQALLAVREVLLPQSPAPAQPTSQENPHG
jgi:hypothetical protein